MQSCASSSHRLSPYRNKETDSFDTTRTIQTVINNPEVSRIVHSEVEPLKGELDDVKGELVDVKKCMELHDKQLEKLTDAFKKLQKETRGNKSSIVRNNKKFKEFAQFKQNHERRLSKLEEGALGSGRGNNTSNDTSRAKRAKRRCCLFCGKELNSDYVARHQKKHCKKAPSNNDNV